MDVSCGCCLRGGGLNCYSCEDDQGRIAYCDGDNEKDRECGDHVIGCIEETVLNKETREGPNSIGF